MEDYKFIDPNNPFQKSKIGTTGKFGQIQFKKKTRNIPLIVKTPGILNQAEIDQCVENLKKRV